MKHKQCCLGPFISDIIKLKFANRCDIIISLSQFENLLLAFWKSTFFSMCSWIYILLVKQLQLSWRLLNCSFYRYWKYWFCKFWHVLIEKTNRQKYILAEPYININLQWTKLFCFGVQEDKQRIFRILPLSLKYFTGFRKRVNGGEETQGRRRRTDVGVESSRNWRNSCQYYG